MYTILSHPPKPVVISHTANLVLSSLVMYIYYILHTYIIFYITICIPFLANFLDQECPAM